LSPARALLTALLLTGVAAAQGLPPLPPGFPAPLIPADNPQTPAKVSLGERLFFTPRLSVTGAYACATCHQPERAFTDGRPRAVGALGDGLRRNAMPLANVAWNAAYNWASPDVRTLEQQLLTPLLGEHPVELGLTGREEGVLAWLAAEPAWRADFDAAFPGEASPVTLPNVARALAAYERSLVGAGSPFDRYVFGDERGALEAPARRGMALFFSARTRCATCHSGPLFGGPVRSQQTPDAQPHYANTGLYDVDGQGGYPPEDTGLREITGRGEDDGRFRVPSLRNVALTAPYMHDGSVATLADVIDHYDRGGRAAHAGQAAPRRDALIRPLGLSVGEKRDLEAFLRSLNSPIRP
jgi:cytochrome c peroxidase